jgi:hypothetical protein
VFDQIEKPPNGHPGTIGHYLTSLNLPVARQAAALTRWTDSPQLFVTPRTTLNEECREITSNRTSTPSDVLFRQMHDFLGKSDFLGKAVFLLDEILEWTKPQR